MEGTSLNPADYAGAGAGELDWDDELDEVLQLEDAERSVWMLKVPDFLYHRWTHASANGEERLGTLRMHPAKKNGESSNFTISLPETLGRALPIAPSSDDKMLAQPIPTEYEVMINNEHSTNLFLFGENEPEQGPSKKRKREPFLAGTVKHECNVKPTMNADYQRIMQHRAQQAAEPKRKLKMMEGDLGTLNRMAAGMGNVDSASGFKGFVKGKTRGGDKTLRLPRPEMETALFQLYDEKAYWGVQEIPMVYVKEVLNDIGQQINAGPYKGSWGLKAAFKTRASQEQAGPSGEAKDEEEDEMLFDEIA